MLSAKHVLHVELIPRTSYKLSPALIANYLYELAREYNQFYQRSPVLRAETDSQRIFRLHLSAFAATVIRSGMSLLGIDVPTRM